MRLFRRQTSEEERLGRFVGGETVDAPDESTEEVKKPQGPSELTMRLEEAIQERGYGSALGEKLARANLKWTVAEFWALNFISVVVFAIIAAVVYTLNPVMILIGGVIGYAAPKIYLSFRVSGRLNSFNDQLGDAITLMANGLRAGYSLLQAMESVGREMPEPIGGEFQRVVQEISLGVDQERSFNNLLRRVPSGDLDLMIAAVNVQSEVGGNLAEILEIIGEVIRERVRIKGQITVLTAQAEISGYVITALPIILGFLLFALNQEYVGRMVFGCDGADLFTVDCSQPCGWMMLGTGALMIVSGYFVMSQMTKIEV